MTARAARRWCIPPAILRDPDENLEGQQILDEIFGNVGLVIWQVLRDVTLWASVEPARRGGLFAPQAEGRRLDTLREVAAQLDPAAEIALTALVLAVTGGRARDYAQVSEACLGMSSWARARGSLATAVAYAQAAALAAPHLARPAYTAGQLAAEWGRAARAETWLRRAIGLARRGRDLKTYAAAYLELARMAVQQRQYNLAGRRYVRALRTARRRGITDEARVWAHHGLLVVHLNAEEWEQAETHANAVLRWTRRLRRIVPLVNADAARLFIIRRDFPRAIQLLRRALDERDGEARALCLALLARAAAGAGDAATYERAWAAAWYLTDKADDEGHALLELVRAAAECGDQVHFEMASMRAQGRGFALPQGIITTR